MIEDDRAQALGALYAADALGAASPETDGLSKRAAHLAKGTMDHRDELDAAITAVATSWRLERMAAVDRNILRLAAFELRHTDLSAAVVIDEAIELAKEYSTAESGRFINGVLDAVASDARSESGRDQTAPES